MNTLISNFFRIHLKVGIKDMMKHIFRINIAIMINKLIIKMFQKNPVYHIDY